MILSWRENSVAAQEASLGVRPFVKFSEAIAGTRVYCVLSCGAVELNMIGF